MTFFDTYNSLTLTEVFHQSLVILQSHHSITAKAFFEVVVIISCSLSFFLSFIFNSSLFKVAVHSISST
ncbi:MAG: hypothetical protein LBU14_03525 [Candidatus Peribacteria bacterium]|nr:hypothetical protein [Candidatus Peribacteria bacterium]